MRRPALVILSLAVLLIVAITFRLMLGPGGLSMPEASAWQLRLDRVLSGVLVGSALALAGVFLQSLLRNPLASPDLIGPASGAGFAVTLTTFLTHASGAALTGAATTTVNSAAALAGALAALAAVYALSQTRGTVDPVRLILVGVIVSIMFGAGTMFLMHLMPDRGLSISRWTIGALSDDVPRPALWVGSALVPFCLVLAAFAAPMLDAAALSDDEAASLGVAIRPLRLGLFAGAGLLTALAVVLAGPVGFVGLIAPHLVRIAAGPSHRTLLIGSALCGATIIVGADAATRAVDLGGGRMPIGIVTAILGGGVFIWIARTSLARRV